MDDRLSFLSVPFAFLHLQSILSSRTLTFPEASRFSTARSISFHLNPTMEAAEHVDHKVDYQTSANGAELSRQVTVSMSPEQYERLFFQPTGPARGDAAKRFANPTLLGIVAFLIPYTATVLILCGFGGAVAPYSLAGISGDYYFLGAIGMNIAGVAEFILGNTFPFSVFVIYGCHWGSLAYTQDPIHETLAAFTKEGGALGAAYNSSQAFHNVAM